MRDRDLRIKDALDVLITRGICDGAEYKDWAIQEGIRILMGLTEEQMKEWLDDVVWEKGKAPPAGCAPTAAGARPTDTGRPLVAAVICAVGVVVMLVLLHLAGCASAPVVRQPVADLPSPWVTLHTACGHQPADGLVPCEVVGLKRAAHQSIDLHEAAELCRADLEAARSLAVVDAAELRGAVARAEAERDRMAGQRWVWAAVGTAAGAIIAGLIAGLAGR